MWDHFTLPIFFNSHIQLETNKYSTIPRKHLGWFFLNIYIRSCHSPALKVFQTLPNQFRMTYKLLTLALCDQASIIPSKHLTVLKSQGSSICCWNAPSSLLSQYFFFLPLQHCWYYLFQYLPPWSSNVLTFCSSGAQRILAQYELPGCYSSKYLLIYYKFIPWENLCS